MVNERLHDILLVGVVKQFVDVALVELLRGPHIVPQQHFQHSALIENLLVQQRQQLGQRPLRVRVEDMLEGRKNQAAQDSTLDRLRLRQGEVA